MRVLYVSEGGTPHDIRFLRSLCDSGVTVAHLAWLPARPEADARPLPEGVAEPARGDSSVGILPRLRRLARAVREFRPQLIHVGPVPGPAFWTAASGYRPLVTMSWGSDLLCDARRGLKRWKARFALQRSHAFVGDCEAVQRAAIHLGMPADRIVIFPWGVDLTAFRPGPADPWRARQGWEDSFIILCTRAFEARYGVELVLEAFLSASRQQPEIRLVLLGGGSQEPQLRETVLRAGAESVVHMIGRTAYADLPAWYRSADVFVTASHCDGSSISLLEAMACGLPVVASDIAGNREWVRDSENGWLFPDGDGRALEAVLLEAFRSRRLALGARSRKIAEERANWDRNFPKLFEAYRLAVPS